MFMTEVGGYVVRCTKGTDGSDVAWMAEALALPGCYCAEDTLEEALDHIKLSIQDWTATREREFRGWLEYPECPYCGAIQEPMGIRVETFRCRCHSCGKVFDLQVRITRRYRATFGEEAE